MIPTKNINQAGEEVLVPEAENLVGEGDINHEIGERPTWKVGTLVYTSAGLITLFCWLLWGDFAWSMKERAVTPVAQLLLKQFKTSDMIIGLLIGSLPSALGMLLGPIISVKSDRHRGRWGRRIPFLLIPTPIAALSMAGIAFTPVIGRSLHETLGAGSPGLGAVTVMVFAFFWTLFEVATVIANTVLGGLINDVVPHEVIGRFFGLFRAVSLLAGIIFNYFIIGHAEQHYVAIFLGIGLVYGVGFSLMCLKVKEGEYPEPEPLVADNENRFIGPIKTYLRECYSNPYYLWVFAAMTFGMLAGGPVNTFSVFYAKSVGMEMDAYGKYVALTYTISLVLSYFIGSFADRFHPLRVGLVAIGIYAVAMLWGGFFATTPTTFAAVFVAHGVLMGTYLTGTAALGQRLFPKAKFAQFFSAMGLFVALAYMVLPPGMGAILDATGHVYRYTFIGSGLIAALAFVGLLVVYKKFMALGGPTNYVAPE